MTITAKNDTVTYKSGRGDNDTVRPAELVVTLPSDGAGGTIDPTLPAEVVGNVAGGGADTGNPVKVGGVFPSALPTLDAGDRGDLIQDTNGNLRTVPTLLSATAADAYTNGTFGFWRTTTALTGSAMGAVGNWAFNGTTWDRLRLAGSTLGLLVENGPYSLGRVTGDGQIKGSAGFIHTISIAPLTATPTAGLLTVYNSTTETGTVVYAEWVFATTEGHTVTLDIPCSTGIYVGFDGTLANVQVTVSYR